MSKELWQKICDFDFDNPAGGNYTFTIRLAKENYWSKNFTELAVLEYKKFMYLAAIADQIVSPSEIVDVVWHQHLVYTNSYNDFCKLAGKQIQHIPSTHNKEDFNRFKLARERTKLLYEKEFGEQPYEIWQKNDMYATLNLEKSKLKIRTFLVWGLVFNLGLLLPSYYFLKPVFIFMSNSSFFTLLIFATVMTIILLNIFNSIFIRKILSKVDKNSFIFNLHPSELIYGKSKKHEDVINAYLDELIRENYVIITLDNKLKASENKNSYNNDLFGIVNKLKTCGPLTYNEFIKKMLKENTIINISNCIDSVIKYFCKSKKFGRIFYINYFFYSLIFLFAFTRLMTGFLRDKPVFIITIVTIILVLVIMVCLVALTEFSIMRSLRKLYANSFIPKMKPSSQKEWRYCTDSPEILTPELNKLINFSEEKPNRKSRNSGFIGNLFYTNSTGNGIFSVDSPSGSSDGSDSSDGGDSSCGSSCGGCGGD